MKNEKVEIDGREFVVSELKYKDVAELQDLSKSESAKRLMQLSTGMSDEDYENLGMSAGTKLMIAVNKLNNIEDFQMPTQQ